MKFAVTAWSKGGVGARAGILQLPGCPYSIETPCLMLSTRKGLPHFLTPDLLSSLSSPHSLLLQVSPLHFAEGLSITTMSSIGGLQKMLGLQDYGMGAVLRDSIICLPEASGSNQSGPAFETPCGRIVVKPVEYMEMISAMKPNWAVSVFDEVPSWATAKRNKKSVDRTLKWLDECIASNQVNIPIFGAIVGGCSMEERKRCAYEVVKHDVSGYFIGGFGHGERINAQLDLLSCVTDILPQDKPRQVCGFELPEEVLLGVAAGIDLFDSSYIYHLTVGGYALTFPLGNSETYKSTYKPSNMDSDATKISLRATVYRKDTSPIVDKCSCYTCQNHTRAYINHLLNVHEMLGQILLEIHNTHHYLGFFHNIRESIKNGKFEDFRCNFIERRNHIEQVATVGM